MAGQQRVYILGAGAVGLPLAVFLAREGRDVLLVRTRSDAPSSGPLPVTIHAPDGVITESVEAAKLSEIGEFDGVVAVAVKSYANDAVATALRGAKINGSIVILQNGLGVEKPFLDLDCDGVCRCVLYMASQTIGPAETTFRSIASCPIGVVTGDAESAARCAEALTTRHFPFHPTPEIQRDVWKKAIINAVFNSICPLLEIDNGIFARDEEVATLAAEIIAECVALACANGIELDEKEVFDQAMTISRGSPGVLISTLQDLRHGRPTEIDSLGMEMQRIGAAMRPPLKIPRTFLAARLLRAKSRLLGGQASRAA